MGVLSFGFVFDAEPQLAASAREAWVAELRRAGLERVLSERNLSLGIEAPELDRNVIVDVV